MKRLLDRWERAAPDTPRSYISLDQAPSSRMPSLRSHPRTRRPTATPRQQNDEPSDERATVGCVLCLSGALVPPGSPASSTTVCPGRTRGVHISPAPRVNTLPHVGVPSYHEFAAAKNVLWIRKEARDVHLSSDASRAGSLASPETHCGHPQDQLILRVPSICHRFRHRPRYRRPPPGRPG
jgi:hypothetical protein